MKKIKKIVFISIIVVVIALGIYFILNSGANANVTNESAEEEKVQSLKVTEDNLASYLSFNEIVQDLPLSAEISLKTTYKEYIVRKGFVREGKAENPDISIKIPSKYIPKISEGFCKTISEANNMGDLEIDIHMSSVGVAWKYKGLYKYKDCL